jgi:hypothetical protein
MRRPDRPAAAIIGIQQHLVAQDIADIGGFRGTSDVRDALTDAQIALMPVPDLASREGWVHTGVCAAVDGILPQLAKICRESAEGQQFYFTGHSLGGGEAPLAAYLLAVEGFNVAGVITFAGMRFASATFAASYNKLLGDRTQRVVAQYDIVPHLPLPGWLLDYRHVGTELYLSAPDPEDPLGNPRLSIDRSAAAMLFSDFSSIYKAWSLLRTEALTLPVDIKAMHAISRYQRLLKIA